MEAPSVNSASLIFVERVLDNFASALLALVRVASPCLDPRVLVAVPGLASTDDINLSVLVLVLLLLLLLVEDRSCCWWWCREINIVKQTS